MPDVFDFTRGCSAIGIDANEYEEAFKMLDRLIYRLQRFESNEYSAAKIREIRKKTQIPRYKREFFPEERLFGKPRRRKGEWREVENPEWRDLDWSEKQLLKQYNTIGEYFDDFGQAARIINRNISSVLGTILRAFMAHGGRDGYVHEVRRYMKFYDGLKRELSGVQYEEPKW